MKSGYSTKNLSKSHPFKFDFHFYLSNSSPWLLQSELNSFNFNPHKTTTHASRMLSMCVYVMLTMTKNFVLKDLLFLQFLLSLIPSYIIISMMIIMMIVEHGRAKEEFYILSVWMKCRDTYDVFGIHILKTIGSFIQCELFVQLIKDEIM